MARDSGGERDRSRSPLRDDAESPSRGPHRTDRRGLLRSVGGGIIGGVTVGAGASAAASVSAYVPEGDPRYEAALRSTWSSPADNPEGLARDGRGGFYVGGFVEDGPDGVGEYAVYRTDGTFAVVDEWTPPGGSQRGAGVTGVAFDGSHVWYALPHRGTWVKDDGTGRVLDRIDVADLGAGSTDAQAITFVDGTTALLTLGGSTTLYEYDTGAHAVVDRTSLPVFLECVTVVDLADRPAVVASSDDGDRLYAVDLDEGAVRRAVRPPGRGDPEGVEVVGESLYYASGPKPAGTGDVYEFDLLSLLANARG